ncbi:MAG: hypothetical protein IPN55_19110 [Saprospiraceae bacterium]|jgi:hypothetical protein|nr:hypothetical protein [Candidatus Brachybacter algidus]
MKKILLLSILFIASIASINAQTRWTWDQYGLSFEAPSSMKVTENDEIKFSAEMDGMAVSMEVMDYEGLTPETMGGALGEAAASMGMSENSDIGPLALTSLAGVYIDGMVEGTRMTMAILFDTESNIAVIVSIAYTDDMVQVSTDVVNSFEMTN